MAYSLQELRVRRQLSVRALSELSGVGVETIRRIERDAQGHSVHEETARLLSNALGMSTMYAIQWPHGITDVGRVPGAIGSGFMTNGATKHRQNTEICGGCYQQKSLSGYCFCL